MKIAIVNQYCDSILPPRQNSVGACTYGVAPILAENAEVRVFALAPPGASASETVLDNVTYQLLQRSRMDERLIRRHDRFARAYQFLNGGMTIPMSAAPWTYPGFAKDAARAVKAFAPDVVFVQHSTQCLQALRRANVPAQLVLNIHHEFYPQCGHKAIARRIRSADAVTTVSEFVAGASSGLLAGSGVTPVIVGNGIDLGEFSNPPPKPATDAPRSILYAGAVSPEKGVHNLVDAFVQIADRYGDIQLDIVGPLGARPLTEVFPEQGDPLFGEIKSLFDRDYGAALTQALPDGLKHRVRMHGMIDRVELVQRYFDASVFVFPSLWNEGFGIPPIEAMAAATPVIGTKTGALTETIEPEKTGLLVPRNEPAALADAIGHLLSDTEAARTMGLRARETALSQYAWRDVAMRLRALFDQIA